MAVRVLVAAAGNPPRALHTAIDAPLLIDHVVSVRKTRSAGGTPDPAPRDNPPP